MAALLVVIALTSLDSSNEQPEAEEPVVITEVPAAAVEPEPEPEPTTEVIPEVVATEYASYDAMLEDRVEEAKASMDLIMRLVIAEAGNQGYDGMRAVAQVIYDRRYNSSYDFGQTFEEIIYAPKQFTKPYSGDISPWLPTAQEACEAVFYQQDMYFDEPVHYFYRADKVDCATLHWFETKKLVGTLGAHTFRSDAE